MNGALLLAGLLFLVAAVLRFSGVRGPRLAVALIMITAPLEVYRTELGAVGNVSLFRLAVVFGVLTVLREPRALPDILRTRVVLALFVLPLVMLISTGLFSDNARLAAAVFGQAVTGVLAVVVILALAPKCPPRDPMFFFLAGAGVSIVLAGAQGIAEGLGQRWRLPLLDQLPVPTGLEVTRSYGSRMIGTGQLRLRAAFGDPNHTAAYLVLVLATISAFLSAAPRLSRGRLIATGVWVVGVLVVLLATLSRSGWLAAFVGTALLTLAALNDPRARAWLRARRRYVAGAVCVLLLAVPFAAGQVLARFDSAPRQNEVSNAEHRETAAVAFDQFRASPVVGIGLAELGPILLQGPRTSGAHSSMLTIAAELGLVGLLALALLFGMVLSTLVRWGQVAIRQRWVAWSLAAGYAGFIVANGFYDLYLDDYHWAFIGLAIAASRQTWDSASA